MEKRDSFVFYRSFLESIEEAQPDEQLQLYRAIALYALNQEEPKLKGLVKSVWLAIKPQIDANFKRYINGKKERNTARRGAPKGNSNARKQPQNNPKTTPNVNVNDNVNDNVNVHRSVRGGVGGHSNKEEVRLFFKRNAKPGQNHARMSYLFFHEFNAVGWIGGADNTRIRNWRALALSWINSDNEYNSLYDDDPWRHEDKKRSSKLPPEPGCEIKQRTDSTDEDEPF